MRPAFSFRVSDYDESGHSHNNFNFFDIQIIACKINNITLYKFIIAEMGCMIKKKQNKVSVTRQKKLSTQRSFTHKWQRDQPKWLVPVYMGFFRAILRLSVPALALSVSIS